MNVPRNRWIPWLLIVTFVIVAGVYVIWLRRDGHVEGEGQPKSLKKVRYAMPITIAAVPAYVALDKGFWADEGLDVEATMFSAGRLALDALLSRNAEVMSVSETPLMHAIRQGNEIRIVTTVTRHQEAKILVRKSKIPDATRLQGQEIATLPGTNSDYFLYAYLARNGIDPKDVKITRMEPPQMVTAFVSGALDAYAAWEPHVRYGMREVNGDFTVIEPGELYHGWHCVAMNAEYIAREPEVVEKLLRGFVRAERFVREDPDEAQAIVARRTNLPPEVLKSLWREYTFVTELPSGLLGALEQESKWAASVNPNSPLEDPEFRRFIYVNGLRKIKPDALQVVQ